MRLNLVSLFCVAVLASMSCAAVVHVPADEATIQAGINAAGSGDTVLVACGTYSEHDITLKAGVTVASETGTPDCVTVDAQQLGRVFYCLDLDVPAVLRGLTVTGGYHSSSEGGGVLCDASGLTLDRCVFTSNRVSDNVGQGGAVACYYGSILQASNCSFINNRSAGGGGVYLYGMCHGQVSDCEFRGNSAHNHVGGGLFVSTSCTADVSRCLFEGNWVDEGGADNGFGGGFATSSGAYGVNIADCVFIGNDAAWGGAIRLCSGPTVISNCTMVGNRAVDGSGVWCYACEPTIENCIIAFNTEGEAVVTETASRRPSVYCTDIYGNPDGDWTGSIADQLGMEGNISENPMFCDEPAEDFSLDSASPCAPSNNECGTLIGALPVDCGASTAQSSTWGMIKAIFR